MKSTLRKIEGGNKYNFVTDINSPYNQFEKYGKLYTNENFTVFREDADAIHALIGFIWQDPGWLEEYGLERTKGLIIVGPIGCGKSSFLRILRGSKKESNFFIISAKAIVNQYLMEGPLVIQRYVNSYQILCIDDMGEEFEANLYGNPCNVIHEILKGRSERLQFEKSGTTHITTRLNLEELRIKYGDDIFSIMVSLFRPILFSSNSIDKRRIGL